MVDTHAWNFPAQVRRVVDGDTLDVRTDLGFRNYSLQRVRLGGIDTAEIYGVSHDTEEYHNGMIHSKFVSDWVDDSGDSEFPFILVTEKESGKYGRWIGDLKRRSDGLWLTDCIVGEFPEVGSYE